MEVKTHNYISVHRKKLALWQTFDNCWLVLNPTTCQWADKTFI